MTEDILHVTLRTCAPILEEKREIEWVLESAETQKSMENELEIERAKREKRAKYEEGG